MSLERLPILYSFRRCPYAMRARLAISAADITCELREVVLRNKPAALLEASPKGTVPVLVLPDGHVVDESLEIMLWALQRNDPQRWLAPSDSALEPMLALIADNDGIFKGHLDRYKYPQRFGLESGINDRDAGARWLHELDARLKTSSYLFGDTPSLADMAIAPFVRQYAHTDRNWFWAQDWSALCRWLDAFLESSLFGRIMLKYAPWEPDQQEVVRFPSAVADDAG